MKSPKNILREIYRAQGLDWSIEPTDEAVSILSDALHQNWSAGTVSLDDYLTARAEARRRWEQRYRDAQAMNE